MSPSLAVSFVKKNVPDLRNEQSERERIQGRIMLFALLVIALILRHWFLDDHRSDILPKQPWIYMYPPTHLSRSFPGYCKAKTLMTLVMVSGFESMPFPEDFAVWLLHQFVFVCLQQCFLFLTDLAFFCVISISRCNLGGYTSLQFWMVSFIMILYVFCPQYLWLRSLFPTLPTNHSRKCMDHPHSSNQGKVWLERGIPSVVHAISHSHITFTRQWDH